MKLRQLTILRLLLLGCVLGFCSLRIAHFATFIGRKPPVERYRELVDYLRENRQAISSMAGESFGIYVTYRSDGAYYYMQMALAPLHTAHRSDLPVVLVLAHDDADLDKWMSQNKRSLISRLGNGLALTAQASTTEQVQP